MLIGLDRKFLFVANLKSASTSIENALRSMCEIVIADSKYGKHLPLCLIQERFAWIFNVLPLQGFFTFGVIRDPAEYIVSIYNSHSDDKFKEFPTLYTGEIDFDCFLNEWIKANPEQIIPQFVRFLTTDGSIGANYLITHSKLHNGLNDIRTTLRLPEFKKLEQLNISPSRMSHSSLSEEQRAWIASHFKEDYRFLENFCDRSLPTDERRSTSRTYGQMAMDLFAPRCEAPSGKVVQMPWQELLIEAMYRTFLGRDPDPTGIVDIKKQLKEGRTIEDIFSWWLRSKEFGEKHQRFLNSVLDPSFRPSEEAATG